MKLAPEWKRIARRAWSMRFAALSVVLGVLELVPLLDGFLPPRTFAVLSLLSGVATLVARLVHQPEMQR